MNADTFRMLFDYNYWAHRRVWDKVAKLSDTQFNRPFDYSIGSVNAQVVHTMAAEEIWYFRLRGESLAAMRKPEDFETRAEIREKWDLIERNFRAYVANLTDDDLLNPVTYRTTTGRANHDSLAGILLHVCNHGTDHRAQILSLLHHLGAETVDQDLIAYMREKRAQAAR
jgi:uncharacterized damage-inducible protein DinB